VGSEEPLELPGSLSHLKQLTRLDIASCEDVSELPEDLGVWLPHLQQLEAEGCSLQAVPASLTALTTLYLTRGCADSLALPTTLSNLREVELRNSSYTSVTGLSSMLFLEYLDVANSSALCSSLAALQPLTRLRHLDLGGVEDLDPSSFTVLGALQALTYLGLAAPECKQTATACSRILAGAAPLAALVELDLGGHSAASLAALGPWLAGLTALTKLTMSECEVSSRGKMLHLPAGLRELGLRSCKLQQVPPGLKRLSALEVLNLSDNPKLCKLPTWLSQLGCLEALDLISTGVVSEQQVLAQMPTLRCVQIFQRHAKEVYGAAAHLHWGHSTRLEED
jgi:Leucine-rich repeat (LRR) protein